MVASATSTFNYIGKNLIDIHFSFGLMVIWRVSSLCGEGRKSPLKQTFGTWQNSLSFAAIAGSESGRKWRMRFGGSFRGNGKCALSIEINGRRNSGGVRLRRFSANRWL